MSKPPLHRKFKISQLMIPLCYSLSLLVFFNLFDHTTCTKLKQRYNISQLYPDSGTDHIFGIATDSPIAKEIRVQPRAKKSMRFLISVFRKLTNVMDKRRVRQTLNACTPPPSEYRGASVYSVRIRQMGEEKLGQSCDTKLIASAAVASGELDPVKDIQPISSMHKDANIALYEAAKQISQIPSTDNESMNWTRGTYRIGDWDLRRQKQQCTLERTIGYTIKGKWYIRVAVTNAHVDVSLGERQRHYIAEYVSEDLEDSLTTIHPRYDNVQQNLTQNLIKATTLFERWAGRIELSSTGNFDMDETLALKEALKLNSIAVNLASDRVTISNLAILVLPVLMTLIPIAFIANLNSSVAIWYIFFTDVFSVLPLFIQGIELVISTTKREAIAAWKLGNSSMGQLELFSAKCWGENNFRKWGIFLIVISIVAIVIGISSEIYAERYMRKKRSKGYYDSDEGPFGKAGLAFTKNSLLGPIGVQEQNEKACH